MKIKQRIRERANVGYSRVVTKEVGVEDKFMKTSTPASTTCHGDKTM